MEKRTSSSQAVIKAASKVAVFPGSETFLTQALSQGGAGCISATVNLNAKAIRAVYADGTFDKLQAKWLGGADIKADKLWP